jgi:hypothetical protein
MGKLYGDTLPSSVKSGDAIFSSRLKNRYGVAPFQLPLSSKALSHA